MDTQLELSLDFLATRPVVRGRDERLSGLADTLDVVRRQEMRHGAPALLLEVTKRTHPTVTTRAVCRTLGALSILCALGVVRTEDGAGLWWRTTGTAYWPNRERLDRALMAEGMRLWRGYSHVVSRVLDLPFRLNGALVASLLEWTALGAPRSGRADDGVIATPMDHDVALLEWVATLVTPTRPILLARDIPRADWERIAGTGSNTCGSTLRRLVTDVAAASAKRPTLIYLGLSGGAAAFSTVALRPLAFAHAFSGAGTEVIARALSDYAPRVLRDAASRPWGPAYVDESAWVLTALADALIEVGRARRSTCTDGVVEAVRHRLDIAKDLGAVPDRHALNRGGLLSPAAAERLFQSFQRRRACLTLRSVLPARSVVSGSVRDAGPFDVLSGGRSIRPRAVELARRLCLASGEERAAARRDAAAGWHLE